MGRIRLISAHFFVFLFFIGKVGKVAFEEANLEIINVLSNIIPALVEIIVDSALETKLNRLRRKNDNTYNDIEYNREEGDYIQPQTKRIERNYREPKIWDQWGNWSACSVTCGIGKIMRWRHCIGGSCSLGEKKVQLKTCTSAAC